MSTRKHFIAAAATVAAIEDEAKRRQQLFPVLLTMNAQKFTVHPVRRLRGRRQAWPHWDMMGAALVGLALALACWLALPQ